MHEAEPIPRHDSPPTGAELAGQLRAAIYRRYRAVYQKLTAGEHAHRLNSREAASFRQRLKDTFVRERSAAEWERIVGPTRPTRAELEAEIAALAAQGQTVIMIRPKDEYEIRDGKITGSLTVRTTAAPDSDTEESAHELVLHDGEPFDRLVDPETGETYRVDEARLTSFNGQPTGIVTFQRSIDPLTIPIVEGQPYFRWDGAVIDNVVDFEMHDDGTFSGIFDTEVEDNVGVVHGWTLKELDGIRLSGPGRQRYPSSLWVHDDGAISASLHSDVPGEALGVAVFRGQQIHQVGERWIKIVDRIFPAEDTFNCVFRDSENKYMVVVNGEIFDPPFDSADELLAIDLESVRIREGKLSGLLIYRTRGQVLFVDGVSYGERLKKLLKAEGSGILGSSTTDVVWSDSGLPSARILDRDGKTMGLLVEGELRKTVGGIPADELKSILEWHIYDGTVNGLFELDSISDQGEENRFAYVVFDEVVSIDR